MKTNNLEVFLYHNLIGTLSLLPGERTLFTFNSDYINNENRPLLSLSFKNKQGDLLTEIPPTRVQVPPFFSNLLPEGYLRDYLASSAGINPNREFFLLKTLGKDLPGAITISTLEKFSETTQSTNYQKSNDNLSLHALRFSLAGVQLKFSAIHNQKGLTIPAKGIGGSWIVKLPSERFHRIAENEYSMMTLARLMGMNIPDLELISVDKILGLPSNIGTLSGNALAIRRFDRGENGKLIHIEDFAQVFNVYPKDKYSFGNYKNIAQVLWAETDAENTIEFIRRLIFNTLIGNGDMHLKNWSLIYTDPLHPSLSPGYDFVSSIAYIPDETMALNYVKSKKIAELSLEQLRYFAAKSGIPEDLVLNTSKDTVIKFLKIWQEEQKNLPLEPFIIKAIENNLKKIKLIREI